MFVVHLIIERMKWLLCQENTDASVISYVFYKSVFRLLEVKKWTKKMPVAVSRNLQSDAWGLLGNYSSSIVSGKLIPTSMHIVRSSSVIT